MVDIASPRLRALGRADTFVKLEGVEIALVSEFARLLGTWRKLNQIGSSAPATRIGTECSEHDAA
jgi:hypothetical protein